MKLNMLTAALMLAGAAIAAPASATVVITGITYNPGTLSGAITYSPSSYSRNVGVGRFELTGTNQPSGTMVDYLTYCVDIFNGIHNGSFEVSPLATIVSNATKQSQLLALLTNGDPLIGGAATQAAKLDIAAAIQLAVWDILYETGTASYSLSNGNFTASGADISKALVLADTYLNNVATNFWKPVGGYTVQALYARDNQSQIFLNGVPEPAAWALMIGGFGLVGGMMRRRRNRTMTVTA